MSVKKNQRKKEKMIKALQESEKRYRRLFESAKDGILIVNADTGKVVDVNPFLCALIGYSFEAVYGKHLWELGAFKDIAASKEAFKNLQENHYVRYENLPLATFDGQKVAVEFVSNVYLVDGRKVIQCNIRDITARKQAENILAENDEKMRSILDNIGIGVALISPDMKVIELNRKMREWFPDVDIVQSPTCYHVFNDSMGKDVCKDCPTVKTLQDGDVHESVKESLRAGIKCCYRIVSSPLRNVAGEVTAAIEMVEDITERLSLESQFLQAQKLESVGRLAGGVAHDYNNMLSVILGYAELAMGKVTPAEPVYRDLEAITKAARRSTEITRQLLAFSRKQTIAPQLIDLNGAVEGLLKMLTRLIGEDIDLTWRPGKSLWPAMMDPSQLDQILINLCVNSRDAIADIGKITIETGMATLDKTFCNYNEGFIPGEYVWLTVSDDGCGMDREIRDKIFEPFFTTKGVGRGTGLGLSTVYGIVKQNQGFIHAYSEPGKGTTFRIYLPCLKGAAVGSLDKRTQGILAGHGETILVVEDEADILKMTQIMLEKIGYSALTAGTTDEAMGLAEAHPGGINLLITDVVMPEMNGRELAERLILIEPGLNLLFMSGYTSDVIAQRGVLSKGVSFIQKPFSMKELALKVHEALGKDSDIV